MKLEITVAGLASFEFDEPSGFVTAQDRIELERRVSDAVSQTDSSGDRTKPRGLKPTKKRDIALAIASPHSPK